MTPKDDRAWIVQMIQQNDDKHEDAHARIRGDHRALEAEVRALSQKVASLEFAIAQNTMTMKLVNETPVDIGKIVFNPKMVLAIVGLAVSTVTGNSFVNWWVQSPVRTDVSAMRTQMTVSDERATTFKNTLDKLEKNSALQQMQISEITTALKVRGIIKP